MQQYFEQFVGKRRRVELKSVGNVVAKAVLVENANQFSLEELCRTQYSLKYFYAPGSNDRGILFLSCLSVCMLSTLTFALTFDP